MGGWELEPSGSFDSRYKRFEKNHRRELKALLANLQRYLALIEDGQSPQFIKLGFLHRESDGIKAIDQKGGGPGLMESRLYVYPDRENQVLHLLCIGNKAEQHRDMVECRAWARQLRG